jgi:Rod binding domain-containing protein
MDPISALPALQAYDTSKRVAQDLEASFLSEMLKAAGVGQPVSFLGGGVGEEQFSSFLRDEHARILSSQGTFGLAEAILRSLQSGPNRDQE